jgi:hypothetical protein
VHMVLTVLAIELISLSGLTVGNKHRGSTTRDTDIELLQGRLDLVVKSNECLLVSQESAPPPPPR